MIFLLLAIASSALVSLMMRASETHIHSKTGLLAVNYIVCTATAALYAAPQLQPGHSGLPLSLGLGLITGIFYLTSFLLLQWNVRINGVVPSAAFMKLGVLVPTLLSVVLFHEQPSLLQLLGCGLALAAILIFNSEKGAAKAQNGAALLMLLLIGGLGDVVPKFHNQYAAPELESDYLLCAFAAALALCLVLTLARRERIGKQELLYGLLIGLPNYFSARFLLGALARLPAVAVYPSYSIATILVISAAGRVFFGEKLGRRQLLGGVLILAALALLNL